MPQYIVRDICQSLLAPVLEDLVGWTGQELLRLVGVRRKRNAGLALCVGGAAWLLTMLAGATAWLVVIA